MKCTIENLLTWQDVKILAMIVGVLFIILIITKIILKIRHYE